MREIKFRGKRVDSKEWVYGSYVEANTLKGNYFIVLSDGNMIEVIPETIGQSIGLKDKNGKDAHGDDRVKFPDEDLDIVEGVIEWQDNAGYWAIKANHVLMPLYKASWFEITGDIHTKLLEKE